MKKYFVILLLLLTLGIWDIAYSHEPMVIKFNGLEVRYMLDYGFENYNVLKMDVK